jgi:hypothetical protein
MVDNGFSWFSSFLDIKAGAVPKYRTLIAYQVVLFVVPLQAVTCRFTAVRQDFLERCVFPSVGKSGTDPVGLLQRDDRRSWQVTQWT